MKTHSPFSVKKQVDYHNQKHPSSLSKWFNFLYLVPEDQYDIFSPETLPGQLVLAGENCHFRIC